MTHKEICVCNCREHLQSRSLLHVFDQKVFEHYYRKNHGAQGNAFLIGLNAADLMITEYKPKEIKKEEIL